MTSPSPPNDSLARNIQVVADLEREATRRRSIAARICGRLTNYAGTTWSIVLHAAWFVVWIALNTGFRGFRPFDPFPFQLLTSVVSLESIFLTLFVLASQNRLTKEADKRTHLDLQVNMLAEQEMTLVTPDLMPSVRPLLEPDCRRGRTSGESCESPGRFGPAVVNAIWQTA